MKKGTTFGIFTTTSIAVGMLIIAFQNAGTVRSTETLLNKRLSDGNLTVQKRDVKLAKDDYKIILSDKKGKNRLDISTYDIDEIAIKDEKGSYSMVTSNLEVIVTNSEKTVLDRKFDMGKIEIKRINNGTRSSWEYWFYRITVKDDNYKITMEIPGKPKIRFTDDEGMEYKFPNL